MANATVAESEFLPITEARRQAAVHIALELTKFRPNPGKVENLLSDARAIEAYLAGTEPTKQPE